MRSTNGIVSEQGRKQFGEVFTPDSIVNDMLNMIDEQSSLSDEDYINQTYLEPACGDGQFLIRILYRKLERVQKLPKEQQPLALIKSLCSIYGVDIQAENVNESIERMKLLVTGQPVSTFDLNNKQFNIEIKLSIDYTEQLNRCIDYVLSKNIILGNTLDKVNPLLLTVWKFNGEQLSTYKCPIHGLEMEIDKTPEVHYLNIANTINNDTSGASLDDF